ncbi:HEC/Ndc80p family-domain-containing protein [Parasitella parasitica]|nr:HEC/Ndc80p family-domain-containing protein [Parasitella parasitica]
MYSQLNMNDNRKRTIPLNSSTYPSKRTQRLSTVMNKLNLSSDEASSIAPQRTVHNYDPSTTTLHAHAAETEPAHSISKVSKHVYTSQHLGLPNDPVSSLDKKPLESDSVQEFEKGEYMSTKKFPSDPRSIKDSDTQRRYLQTITEYLNRTNYKSASQSRNIRILSSTEFHAMLKHLLLRWDPDYRPKKKFEDEVVDLLRQMGYPLRDSISRKSLLSIGAIHSNPIFFGLLYWVVQMCKANDLAESDDFEEPIKLEMDRNSMAKVFVDFTLSTYHIFMNADDDYSVQVNALTDAIGNISITTKRQISELELESQTYKDRCAQLESQESPLNDLKKRYQELTVDIAKFRAYCEKMQKRVSKYQKLSQIVKDEIKRLRKENQPVKLELEALEARLNERNVSVKDLKEKNTKAQETKTKLAELTAYSQDRKAVYNHKTEILSKLKEKVRAEVENYNIKVKKLFPSVMQYQDMLITYNSDGTTMNEMISVNINQVIIPKLESLEQGARDEFEHLQKETENLREILDTTRAESDQIKSNLEMTQKEFDARKNKYDEYHESTIVENEKFNMMVDSHERALEKERSEHRSSTLQAKERLFVMETQ